ncbi:unnamed protein product [Closterium sp. NIES-54]
MNKVKSIHIDSHPLQFQPVGDNCLIRVLIHRSILKTAKAAVLGVQLPAGLPLQLPSAPDGHQRHELIRHDLHPCQLQPGLLHHPRRLHPRRLHHPRCLHHPVRLHRRHPQSHPHHLHPRHLHRWCHPHPPCPLCLCCCCAFHREQTQRYPPQHQGGQQQQ